MCSVVNSIPWRSPKAGASVADFVCSLLIWINGDRYRVRYRVFA
jgi:hypothetical protein